MLLSPQALDDLADILQYTLATWGEEQMLAYQKILDNSLQMIFENPWSARCGRRFPNSIASSSQAST